VEPRHRQRHHGRPPGTTYRSRLTTRRRRVHRGTGDNLTDHPPTAGRARNAVEPSSSSNTMGRPAAPCTTSIARCRDPRPPRRGTSPLDDLRRDAGARRSPQPTRGTVTRKLTTPAPAS
jgi:hypothetical protein